MNPIRLEKRIAEKNQFRFYRLALQPTLFGEWSMVREWGRIGRKGRVVTDTFNTFGQASSALSQKILTKQRRGYQIAADIELILKSVMSANQDNETLPREQRLPEQIPSSPHSRQCRST